jgi:hypothetical protein
MTKPRRIEMTPENTPNPMPMTSPLNQQTQFEKIIESFLSELQPIGRSHNPLEILEGCDLYGEMAERLVATAPSDQVLGDIDPFEATQIVARLRRAFNDDRLGTARDIAWRIICAHEDRGIRPRQVPFFEAQKRALMQDLGQTEELRELLLRSIGRNMSVGVLLSCRRFARQEGRINRARMFDQLIIETGETNFCGFTPEVVTEMRAAISRQGNDENFGPYGSPHADESKPAPPPLFNGLVQISDLPNLKLRLLRSSREVDYATHKLKNCLATTYKRRIKSGHCWIVTLEMGGKPVEALEIDQTNRRILQWAGVENMPPNPNYQDSVRSALKMYGVGR